MAREKKPEKIMKPHLIFCEGVDELHFLIAFLNSDSLAFRPSFSNDVQVMDFGGNEELRQRLTALMKTPGFDELKTLLIIRDAEHDAAAASDSIKNALANVGLPVPPRPHEWAHGKKSTAFVLFPQLGAEPINGTLEDLCTELLVEENVGEITDDIDRFIDRLKTDRSRHIGHPHKTKLHTYFSVTDEYVSMKIGEAAKAGAFDFSNPGLVPLYELMSEVLP